MSEQRELDRLADDGCPHTDDHLAGVEVWEDDGGCEILMECPYCNGDGKTNTAVKVRFGRISFDCPECGGTGCV